MKCLKARQAPGFSPWGEGKNTKKCQNELHIFDEKVSNWVAQGHREISKRRFWESGLRGGECGKWLTCGIFAGFPENKYGNAFWVSFVFGVLGAFLGKISRFWEAHFSGFGES